LIAGRRQVAGSPRLSRLLQLRLPGEPGVVRVGKDTRSFAYDGQRRLTSDTLKTSAGATVAWVSYGYNADSEITSQATTGLAGAASNTYTYDQTGRLTSWNNGTATVQYGYDPNGNLTQSGSKSYSYDARDEMTSDGAASYGYTARGGNPDNRSRPSDGFVHSARLRREGAARGHGLWRPWRIPVRCSSAGSRPRS
jgi:YD repeat-containing protein